MSNKGPDNRIFSRATLDISYNLLRKNHPQLALTIRNILFQQPVKKNSDQADNKVSDHFLVELTSYDVRNIIESLMQILNEANATNAAKNNAEDNTSIFRPILIQSIINEWTVLAKSMFDEYQRNKKS